MVTKNELRQIAKNKRSSLNIEEISEKIVTKIRASKTYKTANNVMLFYPLKEEINLLDLLKDNSKNFFLPRVLGENMEVCPYKIGDELNTSNFKTKEPKTNAINPEILDIIFVPALMVDKQLYRVGYGKGFYDRFFHANKITAKKIVPLASLLITDSIPFDIFDVRVDSVITEI